MITKRFKNPRGIDENTPFYGFYVRANGQSRERLKQAQNKASQDMGGTPSNAVLLDELLKVYLGCHAA